MVHITHDPTSPSIELMSNFPLKPMSPSSTIIFNCIQAMRMQIQLKFGATARRPGAEALFAL